MLSLKWYITSNLQDYGERSDFLYEGLYGYLHFEVNHHSVGLFFPESDFIRAFEEHRVEDIGSIDIFPFFYYLKNETLLQSARVHSSAFWFWDELVKLSFSVNGEYMSIASFSLDRRNDTEKLLWEEKIPVSVWKNNISLAIRRFVEDINNKNPDLSKNKFVAALLE